MKNILFVALGGALGSVLRYGFGLLLNQQFPYGTLLVNVLGSFIIGLLFYYVQSGNLSKSFSFLLMVGFCGGFTTFSSFSLEGFKFLQQSEYWNFAIYTLGSLILSLTAVFLGFFMHLYFKN